MKGVGKELESRMKWIPVNERLPEENGKYLTYIKNPYCDQFSYIMTCDYINKSWFPDNETASNNVIYWMSLPAEPEPFIFETFKQEHKEEFDALMELYGKE